MKPITSHRHGHGRLARQAWGSKESCTVCMAEEAQMQKVRRCGCGTLLKRDQEQCDACEKIHSPQPDDHERGRQAFINDEVLDFGATSDEFQEGYKEAWFEITNPPNYGDYVDSYFDDHLTQLHWDYEASVKCTAGDKGCGETPCICRLIEITEPYCQKGGKVTPGEAALFLFVVMILLSFFEAARTPELGAATRSHFQR